MPSGAEIDRTEVVDMRRYNFATALLVSLSLISGCRSESAHRHWRSPVRAVCSCASEVWGDSPQGECRAERSTDPVSSAESEAETTAFPPESDEAVDDLSKDVNVDQPAPFPTDEDFVDHITSPQDDVRPSSDPVESLRSLGGILKFSDDGELLVADLTETAATDADVELLTQIPSLRAVDLSGTHVTNTGLQALLQSSSLKMLGLCDLPIDDRTIREIVDQKNLRFLSLERTAITDDGLRYLRALLDLEGVSLRGTEVSREAIIDFEKAHPNCRVLSDYEDDTSSLQFEPTGQWSQRPDWAGTITDAGTWEPPDLHERRQRLAASRRVPSDPDPVSSDDPEQVVQRLQQIVSERLNDQVVLAATGKVYLTQKRWEDAVSVLSAALEQNPYDDRVRFDLAVALGHNGEIEESLKQFTEVIGPAAAHYNLGVLLYEKGEVQMSRYFFRQANERDPQIEFPQELKPRLACPTSPGIRIQQDAMQAVTSSELLRLVAGPDQRSRPDENWTIEIVPGERLDRAPRCLTTLGREDTLPAPSSPPTMADDIQWVSPTGWRSVE